MIVGSLQCCFVASPRQSIATFEAMVAALGHPPARIRRALALTFFSSISRLPSSIIQPLQPLPEGLCRGPNVHSGRGAVLFENGLFARKGGQLGVDECDHVAGFCGIDLCTENLIRVDDVTESPKLEE